MTSKTFTTAVVRDGSMCFIPLPFDPKAVFGKARAPVKVTLNGHTFRSTIAAMGGPACIPLRRSNREAAGLEGGETLDVRLELDVDPRVVEPPADLVRALKKAPGAWNRWRALGFTHQREHVEAIEGAKKPETRARRVASAVEMASGAPRERGGGNASAQIKSYLASLSPEARAALQKLRAHIRSASSDAVESFSYGIPGFRLDGRPLVWCAAWKNHTSLYPITPALLRAHRVDIRGYETSKGTIRFPLTAPIPSALVRRLVKARVAEVRRRRTRQS